MTALLRLLLIAGLFGGLPACTSSTLPTAAAIDDLTAQVRQQEQPRFDDLERRRAAGLISEADYLAEKAALEKRVTDRVSDMAWTRHFLDQSERKATGLPTPDRPVAINPPNVSGGGGGVGGSLYRPFTQQAQGVWNQGGSFGGGGGGTLPSF